MEFNTVREEPLYSFTSNDSDSIFNQTEKAPKHKAIIDNSSGEIIAVVGTGYKLVQNSEIFPQYEEAIYRSNLNTEGMERKLSYSHNGARTIMSYVFPAHRISIKKYDDMDLQINVLNSYDGSWKFMSLVGAFRLLCTNGQIIGDSFSSFYGKHTKSLDINVAINKLEHSLNVYLNNAELWKTYPNIPVLPTQAHAILEALSKDNKKMLDTLNIIYDTCTNEMGYNLWSLFNTLTNWSSHSKFKNQKNKASTIINREDKVRKILPMLEEIRIAA